METTVNFLELRHADVASLLVTDESQIASFREVRSAEGLEAIGPEAELTSEVVQRRHGNIANVAEGHVGTGDQLGKLNLQAVHVASKVDKTGGLLQAIQVNGFQVAVLGDGKVANVVKGNAVQVSQGSVSDLDLVSLGDTLAEVEGLQVGQSSPLDRAHTGKGAHAKRGKGGEAVELELVANGLQTRSRQLSQVAGTLNLKATLDLLDTIQSDGVSSFVGDLNITLQLLAAGVAIGITLARDLDCVITTAVYHQSVIKVHSRRQLYQLLTGSEGDVGGSQRGEKVLDDDHCEINRSILEFR